VSARVRLARDDDGRLEAVKVARTPSDAAALTREAAVLRAVRHPGVVELVELRGGSDGPELVTRWVGTRSLADLAPLPIEQVAGVVASVAATLADLHARGVVHGAIEPTHVLLDQRGRPVLCSFGRAVVPTTVAGPPPATVDGEADAGRPSDDVRALGELLAATAGRPDDPELVPARRFGRRRTSHLHRDVLTIADHARADDPSCRPSAAAVADALAELVPAVSLPDQPTNVDDTNTEAEEGSVTHDGSPVSDLERQLQRLRATVPVVERPRRRWPIAAGYVGVALAVVGVTAIITAPAAEPPTELVTPTTGTPTTTARAMTTSNPPTTTSTTSTLSTTTASSRPGPPPLVEIDGSVYELGAPGDVAVVANWRCDDRPRPLLLRPGTGELFLFDVAARPGVESVARAFTAIAGAVAVERDASTNGCPRALVTRTDGTTVAVSLPPETP
jgi:serine/threonine protein kinase